MSDMCLDTREDCQYLNRESNICESNNDDRKNACKSTCGYCGKLYIYWEEQKICEIKFTDLTLLG